MPGILLDSLIMRNTTVNRPAPGIAGRLFFDTTAGKLQRDNGTAWEDVEGTGGASGNPVNLGVYGTNVLTGGTASASSEASATYAASKAVDGNQSTYWKANSTTTREWWQYDLGAGVTRKIEKLSFSCAGGMSIKAFSFDGSLDGLNWFTVWGGVGPLSTAKASIEFINSIAYRYYRIVTQSAWEGGAPSMIEVTAYERIYS